MADDLVAFLTKLPPPLIKTIEHVMTVPGDDGLGIKYLVEAHNSE